MSCYELTLVCLMSLTLSASQATAQQPSLRVMTYNVRYAADTGSHTWPERLPSALAMLNEYRPDVIGMQEALYRQVKDFAGHLAEFAWIGLGRDGGSRGEFMAIFYRTSRLDPLAFDHFWLSDTPEVVGSTTWGNRNRRMVTWVLFQDKQTNQRFYFFNTHFDHRIEEARLKSAALVLKRTEQLTDVPVLLVGDFNAQAGDSQVYKTLVATDKFSDTWTTAVQRGEDIGTFHGFSGTPRDSRIDWILARGRVITESTKIVTFQQNNQYPSDHFPVVADVVIAGADD